MRACVQRVCSASVSVADKLHSSIGPGLCVLVGIHREDTDKDVEFMLDVGFYSDCSSRRILNTRLFDGEGGSRWQKSVADAGYAVLLVSQFTLYHIQKGNKPDFHLAMGPDRAPVMYETLLAKLRTDIGGDGERVQAGVFGEYMQVSIQNDGPVTLIFDSRNPKGGDIVE